MMFRLRICALTEDQDGARARLFAKFDDADECIARRAVASLLIFLRAGVVSENHASRAGAARDGPTLLLIAERFTAAGMHALQPVDLSPRDAPRSESLLQLTHHRLQVAQSGELILVLGIAICALGRQQEQRCGD